jgi:hypothetical protein
MATAPINYLAGLNRPNPTFEALSRLGTALGERRERVALGEQQEQARLQQESQQKAIQDLLTLEDPTFEQISKVAFSLPPQLGNNVRAAFSQQNKDQQANQLKFHGQVLASLDASPEIAVNLLNERAEAERNSGDEAEAVQLERLAERAKTNPQDVKKFLTTTTAFLPGGKEVIESLSKLSGDRAGLFAKIDPAKYTPASVETFEKSGSFADLIASPKSLQAVVTGKDKFDAEKDLRKEFSSESKVFKDTSDSFGRIEAVGDSKTAAGDLALIFNFMKMLDPGSVVRESEFRSAEQAKAWLSRSEESGIVIPSAVKTAIQKADPDKKGAFLLGPQRADFITQASKLMKGQGKTHEQRKKTYTEIAKRNGLTVENVVIPFGDPSFEGTETAGDLTADEQAELAELRKRFGR